MIACKASSSLGQTTELFNCVLLFFSLSGNDIFVKVLFKLSLVPLEKSSGRFVREVEEAAAVALAMKDGKRSSLRKESGQGAGRVEKEREREGKTLMWEGAGNDRAGSGRARWRCRRCHALG